LRKHLAKGVDFTGLLWDKRRLAVWGPKQGPGAEPR